MNSEEEGEKKERNWLVMGNDGVNESKVLEEFKEMFNSGNYSSLLACLIYFINIQCRVLFCFGSFEQMAPAKDFIF